MSRSDGYPEFWSTYFFVINGKGIEVVAKDIDSAMKKANKKYELICNFRKEKTKK